MDELIDAGAVSRRRLITGAAAAAALGGVAAAATTSGAVGAAFPALGGGSHPEVIGAAVAGLTYLTIDGFGFQPDTAYGTIPNQRYATDADGVLLGTSGELAASLPLPTGSVIRQINVAYRGSPIINLYRRTFAAATTPGQFISKPLDNVASTFGSTTVNLDTPITVDAASTMSLRFYLSPGSSIFGVTIGYSAPLQGFVPFTGANPRVLDTRSTTKLNPGEDRTVSFASFGSAGARAVLFNLAVTDTEGTTGSPGGFVGAYSGSLSTWPGNASINWFGAGQNLSNAVTSALSPSGEIKLHGGANKTHVVLDVVGYLY